MRVGGLSLMAHTEGTYDISAVDMFDVFRNFDIHLFTCKIKPVLPTQGREQAGKSQKRLTGERLVQYSLVLQPQVPNL